MAGLLLVLLVAVLDWVAVARSWRRLELLAKPLTLAVLFVVLALVGRFHSLPLIFFGLGLLFSLAGDILLLFSERWFVAGLGAFLLAHLCYITGFNLPPPNVSPLWSLGVAVVLAVSMARLLRRIVAGLRARNQTKLVIPVTAYSLVLTLMLLVALLTMLRLDWNAAAALLAALGAFLFFLSDILLAWDRFVTPVRNGRLFNMILYHLGQLMLITGVLLQFAK